MLKKLLLTKWWEIWAWNICSGAFRIYGDSFPVWWKGGGVAVRGLSPLFTFRAPCLRKAQSTEKVRMKKQGSASNPELPTRPPWPWFTPLGKELCGTRTCLMFWGCGNDRVAHGFSAKAAGPLGYAKHREDQSSPWSLVFCSECHTVATCREI